jgi:hypothetical protein
MPQQLILVAIQGVASAQWLEYPTRGVPRTPDGKPNRSAPAPRTADGKPDLSGMWGWETRANCGAHCNDVQISREFINIAASRNGGLPYQVVVAEGERIQTARLEVVHHRRIRHTSPVEADRRNRLLAVAEADVRLTENAAQSSGGVWAWSPASQPHRGPSAPAAVITPIPFNASLRSIGRPSSSHRLPAAACRALTASIANRSSPYGSLTALHSVSNIIVARLVLSKAGHVGSPL